MLNKTVGKNIRKIRLLNGFSQEAVAFAINVSHVTYNKIEQGNGKINIERLEKLAELFKVDINTILNFSSDGNEVKNLPSKVNEPTPVTYNTKDVELAKYTQLNESLQLQVEMLTAELKLKDEVIRDKQTIIDLLSKQSKS